MSFRRATSALRPPPPLAGGQERRVLARQNGEETAGAIARARRMGWWRNVVHPRPSNARGYWIWTVRTA